MGSLGLSLIGSFQKRTGLLVSEEPLEESWNRISQVGSAEFIRRTHKSEQPEPEWSKCVDYASVRVRQAVEFRASASSGSVLTSPLPLYYSFLNLTRALLALSHDYIPAPSHGLTFHATEDVLGCSATICNGTFLEYLEKSGVDGAKNVSFSLKTVLSFIPELLTDFRFKFPGEERVAKVAIKAASGGPVRFHLHSLSKEQWENWETLFPNLAACCTVFGSEDQTVLLTGSEKGMGYGEISDKASDLLWPNLAYSMNPNWFAIQHGKAVPVLPRPAYYYLGMFILGSIVRYTPESLSEAVKPESELLWLLNRFVSLAERFFPQLKLSEHYKMQMYFSGDAI